MSAYRALFGNSNWFPLAVFLFSAACAPKPQNISHDITIPVKGPQGGDVDLKVDGRQAIAPVGLTAEVGPDVVFRFTENLFELRGGMPEEGKKAWASQLLRELPASGGKLVDSAYTPVFIEQAQKMAKASLARIIPQLEATPGRVRRILQSLRVPIGDREQVSLEEAPRRLFAYLRAFDAAIAKASLLKPVIEGIHREIVKMLTLEPRAARAIQTIVSARTLGKALDDVEIVAREFGVKIPAEAATKIRRARALVPSVDAIRDSQTALACLVDVWIYLSPAQRVSQFKAASSDLYDYLSDQSAEDLRCLKDANCWSKTIPRSLVILPKIEEFGVGRIQALLNQKGAEAVREQVRDAIVVEIRGAPATVSARVDKGIRAEIAPILALESNFPEAIKKRLQAWASRSIEADGPAVLTPKMERARVAFGADGRMRITWTGKAAESFDSLAAYDAVAPMLWQTAGLEPKAARGVLLGEISGLVKRYKKMVGSPVDAPKLSARAYAETVRGLANLAIAFREWEPSAFDSLIGSVMAKELFPEFKISDLETSIFPKGAFYALSFHSLADILKSATSERTQVFLVDTNNHVVRANQESLPGGAPAVMAGIADRNGNELGETVRAEDVARYLIAMADVYQATRDVERSTSEILTQPGPDGKTPRDQIIESREKIKILILGLANYLSHQFRSGGELVRHELQLLTQKPTAAPISIIDQALAIRALTAASDILGNELYYWEAVDLLNSMNRRMYRTELGFYGLPGETKVSPMGLLEMIRALDEISPHLSEFSRQQVVNLTAPWRALIATWRLD